MNRFVIFTVNICENENMIVPMKNAIRDGKSPAIQYMDRTWNDKSSGTSITMDTTTKVTYLSLKFTDN